MAAVPRTRRVSVEDFAGLEPSVRKGIEALLKTLNPFLSDVVTAFERRLTWDNFAATIRVVEITASDAMNVTVSCPDLLAPAQNVIVTRCEDVTSTPTPAVAPQIAWENAQGNNGIVIRGHSGLTNGNKYRLRLLVTV